MTIMGTNSQLGDVRRLNKSIRASKKSLYTDQLNKSPFIGQRSISLTALNPPIFEPRISQLESLEAKMANIEVSLASNQRRKKSGLITPVNPLITKIGTTVTSFKTTTTLATTEDIARNLQGLKNQLKDKENIIFESKSSNDCKITDKNIQMSEKCKKAIKERLMKLKHELDTKRLAIKNIKMMLESIDVTDNIDTRIQQAELEYKLGREELNLLSILEESRNLQSSLEEANAQQTTIFNFIGTSTVNLVAVQCYYEPKITKFKLALKEDGGIYVDWAMQECGLQKGDRLLEVNGKVLSIKSIDEVYRFIEIQDPIKFVVMRKPDKNKSSYDSLRLSHRISYLEEQVAELLEAHSRPLQSSFQVFQKGSQIAVINATENEEINRHKNKNCHKLLNDNIELRSTKSMDLLLEKRKDDNSNFNGIISSSNNHLKNYKEHHRRYVHSSMSDYIDMKNNNHSDYTDYHSESGRRHRPIPPRKPARLSLHKSGSLQSMDNEKRALKRTHKSP